MPSGDEQMSLYYKYTFCKENVLILLSKYYMAAHSDTCCLLSVRIGKLCN